MAAPRCGQATGSFFRGADVWATRPCGAYRWVPQRTAETRAALSWTSVRCPWCAGNDDKVVDSRAADDGAVIRRRRECLACTRRYTTFERIEDVPLIVVKRNGTRQPFDRAKLLRGLRAATKNGSLHELQIDAIVGEIEEQVRLEAGPEVSSEAIGRTVLGVLRVHDGVAYVRFASVHQSFTDAHQLAEAAAEVSGPARELPGHSAGPALPDND
jgi:transcriptional repressor NrdR